MYSPSRAAQNAEGNKKPATIKAAKCFLYKGASEDAITKGYLVAGDMVNIIEQKGEWTEIEYSAPATKKTIVRWVKSECVK